MTVDSSIRASFACHGHLRASLNLGNPILANIDPTSGKPFGVSIDLAVELARRLGVDVELIAFDTAGRSVQAASRASPSLRPTPWSRDFSWCATNQR
jgi:polar amino acid transport system substrate-binding protein